MHSIMMVVHHYMRQLQKATWMWSGCYQSSRLMSMHLLKNDHTPYDVAVRNNKEEVAVVLMNEFHCDTKGGTPYIRRACERGMGQFGPSSGTKAWH